MNDTPKGKELLMLESVQTAIESAATLASNFVNTGLAVEAACQISEEGIFDSPIEAIFWSYFSAVDFIESLYEHESGLTLAPHPRIRCRDEGTPAREETYIPDFRIDAVNTDLSYEAMLYGCGELNVLVELDGHDFHEKTKQQVTYRNRRDRHLQAAGWKVLHYSGAELYRDPEAVARAAYEVASDAWRRIRIDLRRARQPVLNGLKRKKK